MTAHRAYVGCHHPPYVVNVDVVEPLSAQQVDKLLELVETRTDAGRPITFLGANGYVSVVECSWCRNPNEFAPARRRWWGWWRR
jgi:hypothetical protein